MDFLKKAAAAAGGSKTGGQGHNQQQMGHGQAGPAGQKEDYGDKAFNFLAKKSGHQVNPATSEKITDGMRGMYEKATGKKVDPKYSN
ncbi:hypothetical protein HYFRA_00005744 [Hymenoscyphus fraxineus]|uniref:Uncharacterized protein n=1 Tax=Hymenoscyphus fraxineus TaxID=746836 RepID=A0A9N9PQY2_9HELO|nr:hypothetical protein HYFRA_00005744 [Hymenoscyphus fraxineus]